MKRNYQMIYNMMTSESLLLLKFVTHFFSWKGVGWGGQAQVFLGREKGKGDGFTRHAMRFLQL